MVRSTPWLAASTTSMTAPRPRRTACHLRQHRGGRRSGRDPADPPHRQRRLGAVRRGDGPRRVHARGGRARRGKRPASRLRSPASSASTRTHGTSSSTPATGGTAGLRRRVHGPPAGRQAKADSESREVRRVPAEAIRSLQMDRSTSNSAAGPPVSFRSGGLVPVSTSLDLRNALVRGSANWWSASLR